MIWATVQLLRPRRAKNQKGGFDPKVIGTGHGLGKSKLAAIQDAVTAFPIAGGQTHDGKRLRMKIKPGDMIQIVGFRREGEESIPLGAGEDWDGEE